MRFQVHDRLSLRGEQTGVGVIMLRPCRLDAKQGPGGAINSPPEKEQNQQEEKYDR